MGNDTVVCQDVCGAEGNEMCRASLSRRDFVGIAAAASVGSLAIGGGVHSIAVAEESKPYDLLIKNGNVYGADGTTETGVDLAVKDGIIVGHGVFDESEASEVIDATGMLVSPSFVDTHMHLDKAFQMEYPEYIEKVRELADEFYAGDEVDYGYPVCGGAERYLMGLIKDEGGEEAAREVVEYRLRKALDMAAANGTCCVKTNNSWGPLSVDVVDRLREEYKGTIDLKNIVIFTQSEEEGDCCTMTAEKLEEYAQAGSVDFVGGYFDGDYGYEGIDALCAFADSHGLPIDVHVLETDVPLLKPFDYFLDRSLEYGFGERITFGHLTSLDAPGVDQDAVAALVEKAAEAEVNVTSLCSCNMYLMGRKAEAPRRVGTTRIDLFQAAGVNTSFASDNIRDAWRPYGNADMLQEALICAHCTQSALPEELERVFRMGTYNAARNALLEGYGTEEGCKADLVVLGSPSPSAAIVEQAKRLWVVKGGKVIAKDGALV